MSRFLDPAMLVWANTDLDKQRRKVYTLIEDLRYEIGRPGSGVIVTVPAGAKTNLATTPRWCAWMFPELTTQHGVFSRAAILHDYLCGEFNHQHWTRYEADAIFRSALISLGCPRHQVLVIYWAVRAWANLTGQTGVNHA